MKERIQLLISHYKMTAAQFADQVGIQRSTLSHILNGRNKPGVDILMKIHEAYPGLSMNWLMFGEGNMSDGSGVNPPAFSGEPEPENYPAEGGDYPAGDNTGCTGEQKGYYQTPPKPYPMYDPVEPSKKIQKIMVFYTDNTFETFSADGKASKL